MATKRYNYETAETAPANAVVDYDDDYTRQQGPSKLFDITCTVGTVYSGGNVSPRVAAFQVIAEHSEGRSGVYNFPNEDGTVTQVIVEENAAPKS